MSAWPARLAPGVAVALVPGAAAAAGRPWGHFAEAPWGYWLIAAVVLAGFLAFTFWALRRRHEERPVPTAGYHALGALVLALAVFTLVLYLVVAEEISATPATEDAWDWRPGETLADPGGSGLSGEPYRGYRVYLAQGCTYCHTLYVRPQDIAGGWTPGARAADVSEAGDFKHFPFTLLGTQRNGPDLTIVGRRIADLRYHVDHLKAPRRFKPRSVMPSYDYLPERDLGDLAAFLVSLGNPPERLRAGALGAARPRAEESPLVAMGRRLYKGEGCVSCHTTDGSPSAGPTFKGLFGSEETLADGGKVTVDVAYLRESITHPEAKVVKGFQPIMPPFDRLSDEQLEALVAFLESLGAASEEAQGRR